MKKLIRILLVGVLLSAATLHAQPPDADTLAAIEATDPLSPDVLPSAGNYYSLAHPTWPPLPSNFGMPAWQISSNAFVVDDVDYAPVTMSMSRMDSMDDLSPGDGGDGGSFYSDSFFPIDYGTNLYIAQANLASGYYSGIISNSFADIQYELQYKTDLAQADWQSANWFVFGDETTNWTSFSVAAGNPTNMFFRIRSWQDDGSGLPLWWQLDNFGTTGVDPYGDPAGDGWNNLQKFQNGMDPNAFYTPPAPQGLTVQYDADNSTAQINWLPSPGPVTGYTVERSYYSGSTDYSASTTSLQDSSLPGIDVGQFWDIGATVPVSYRVQAHYAAGDSAWSADVPLQPNPQSLSVYGPPLASFIAGPQGATYLAAPVLPEGTIALRVFRYSTTPDPVPLTNFDIPVTSITNGLYPIPASWNVARANAYGYQGYEYWVQAVMTNGDSSTSGGGPYWGNIYSVEDLNSDRWLSPPYFDGRVQLKQNLIFQLRAAMKDFPFEYTATWWGWNPQMVFTTPTNYVYAGFYQLDEVPDEYSTYEQNFGSFDPFWPFENNWRYRNFVFNLQDFGLDYAIDSYCYSHSLTGISGSFDDYYNWPFTPTPLTLGARQADAYPLPDYTQPKYVFQTPDGLTNGAAIPSMLDDSQWLATYPVDSSEMYFDGNYGDGSDMISYGYLEEIGVTPSVDTDWDTYYNSYETMASNARNYWGLPFVSAQIAYPSGDIYDPSTTTVTNLLTAGNQLENIDGCFYPEVAQPEFQTTEYDFWNSSPLPGMTNFSSGQASDLLIAPVGSSIGVNGYAKLGLQNGYSGVYAYLGQYFDKAYKIDATGSVTTNETGLLSSYGNFFATEPGPVALVTMPDIDTGEQGTGVVYCVSLNVDKNHDTNMDLSFSGPDTTSVASPMIFWINNRHIELGQTLTLGLFGNPLDHDVQTSANFAPDYSYGEITCARDLEDFARLWICGMPSLSASQGYSIVLSCTAISGSPSINLYLAETNGGIGYLTDTNVAANLVGENKLGTISPGNTYVFPDNFFTNSVNKYFLFEGAGIGEGQFTLTIYRGATVMASTSIYIDLHDIRDLYEQAHITGLTQDWPQIVDSSTTSGFQVDHPVSPNLIGDEKQVIAFVHGWRITQWAYYDFSETMFRRLYWQGFSGVFASLRWPCFSSDSFGTNADVTTADIASFLTFNRSERMGLESGTGAAAYFSDLKQRYTNYDVNVCSHSQGADVVAAALTQLAGANQKPIQNYVIMQGAFAAQSYDSAVPNYPLYMTMEGVIPTPNTYLSYAQSITNAVQGTIVNFFNTNDFALNLWNANQSFFEIVTNAGVVGYIALKPDTFLGYQTDGTSAWLTNNLPDQLLSTTPRSVSDPLELMPFVSRPHSLAVGELSGVHGVVDDELDLILEFGFTGEWYDHSGEFNRSIQEPEGNQFYFSLLRAIRTGHP